MFFVATFAVIAGLHQRDMYDDMSSSRLSECCTEEFLPSENNMMAMRESGLSLSMASMFSGECYSVSRYDQQLKCWHICSGGLPP